MTSAVYGGTLASGFVWDDAHVIVGNPATRDITRLGEVLLSPDEVRPYYRPLNRASYLVDHWLFGMDPRAFHAVNVLLHLAGVLLLFALARRLLDARWPAVLAAALLAVHPIHAEAVNFVTARNNLFAVAFALATLVLFVDATRRASHARAWLSGAAFFLGLASKEQAAMVLPVAAAWLALPTTGAAWRGWRGAHALVPHAIAVGLYVALRSIALGAPLAASGVADGLLARLAQNAWIMPRYGALLAWPDRLTIFHAASPPDGPAEVAAIVLFWTAVAAWMVVLIRRPTLAGTVGLLWLAANLLPISNLVPIPATTPLAERFFHAPAVGVWLLVADAAVRLARSGPPLRRAVAACAVVALAGLAVRTVARNQDWRDDVALAQSAIATDPRAVRAWFNLGVVLKDAGDLEGAERAWLAALEVEPRDAETLTQLGTLAAVRGDFARAETLLRRALASDPGVGTAHLNLARIYDRTGRRPEALHHYEAFLAIAGDAANELAPAAVQRVLELRR